MLPDTDISVLGIGIGINSQYRSCNTKTKKRSKIIRSDLFCEIENSYCNYEVILENNYCNYV